MHTKRKYEYRNTGFPNMRDREKAKEIEKQKKKYPWRTYGV